MNGGGGRGGAGGGEGLLRLEIGGNDPITGEPLGAIASRSRSMHKSQGFGNFGGGGGGPRTESFQLLAGEPATKDLLDGVDTTWGRIPGGAEIGLAAEAIIAQFDQKNPSASVPALLELRSRLAKLPGDRLVEEKRLLLDQVLKGCLGLVVLTVVPRAEVVPGQVLAMRHTVTMRAGVPVRWLAVRYTGLGGEIPVKVDLNPDRSVSRESNVTLPADMPIGQPYWLREAHPTGVFRVDDPGLIGRPENPPAFPIAQVSRSAARPW